MSRKIKIKPDGSVEIQHFDSGGTVLGGPGNGTTTDSSTDPNTGVLGSINGALGLNNNFEAGSANIQQGTNAAQLNNAYTGATGALTQEQQLAQALQPGGVAAAGSQTDLLNALTNEANGGGPNPAQASLNQNTGTNVANQAALQAGQRGASGNVGLIARQAGQQGAATQQQAVGQAATQQATQQLNAQAQEQAQQQALVAESGQTTNTLNQAEQNEQNILQNANTAANSSAVTMQSNINNANAQTSAANQNAAGNTFGGITSGLSSSSSALSSLFAKGGEVPSHMKQMAAIFHPGAKFADGGEVGDEDAPPSESSAPTEDDSNKSNTPEVSESAPETATQDETNFTGGGSYNSSGVASTAQAGNLASLPAASTDLGKDASGGGGGGGSGGGGGAGIAALAALAKGGVVRKYAQGGITDFSGAFTPSVGVGSSAQAGSIGSLPGASTDLGKDMASKKKQDPSIDTTQGPMTAGGVGDPSDAVGSDPNNTGSNPDGSDSGATEMAAEGGWMGMQTGGKIAGKPKVNKDSYSNDTVKAMVSPGEVVIPLHVMNSDDPAGNSAKFVAAILAKHGKEDKGNEADDFKSALKSAIASRKGKH